MVPLQCSKTFYNLQMNDVEADGDVQLLVLPRKELQLREGLSTERHIGRE